MFHAMTLLSLLKHLYSAMIFHIDNESFDVNIINSMV